ncbi:MAG: flavin reductase [Oscillospiraceae bacterium]|nr:flavin reductase [Oscillospiraceae bacterium]
MAFVKKEIADLQINPFTMIGKKWFLLSAGTLEDYNTMTCSWGAVGEIWNAPSVTAYVRTNRYTHEYLEKNQLFTISVFPEEYRKALAFCGSHSGRDCDKAKETGLTPVGLENSISFAQAELVFVCEKVYRQTMQTDSFLDPENLEKFYVKDPLHDLYIGKILAVYENQA